MSPDELLMKRAEACAEALDWLRDREADFAMVPVQLDETDTYAFCVVMDEGEDKRLYPLLIVPTDEMFETMSMEGVPVSYTPEEATAQ